jgi:hypothetical protein
MPSTSQESTVLPNMISPPKPAEIAEGVLATSDKPVYVNFSVVAGVSHPKHRNRLKKKIT